MRDEGVYASPFPRPSSLFLKSLFQTRNNQPLTKEASFEGSSSKTVHIILPASDDHGDPARAGSGLVRKAHHRAQTRQRPDRNRHGAPRSPRLLVRNDRERRVGSGSTGDHRPRAHVRTHGVQRHRQSRHVELHGGVGRAGESRRGVCRLRPRAPRSRQPRRREDRFARQSVEVRHRRRAEIRSAERVQQDRRPLRRRRRERLHEHRRDRVLLLAAVESRGALGLSRLRAFPPPGLPRVLQRARSRSRRAPHAHGKQSVRTSLRASPGNCIYGPSVRSTRRRLAVGSGELLRHRCGRVLQKELRPRQHGHRPRWRPQSSRGHADHGEVLRAAAESAGA